MVPTSVVYQQQESPNLQGCGKGAEVELKLPDKQ